MTVRATVLPSGLDNADGNRTREEETWIFGETLPHGLALFGEEKRR